MSRQANGEPMSAAQIDVSGKTTGVRVINPFGDSDSE